MHLYTHSSCICISSSLNATTTQDRRTNAQERIKFAEGFKGTHSLYVKNILNQVKSHNIISHSYNWQWHNRQTLVQFHKIMQAWLLLSYFVYRVGKSTATEKKWNKLIIVKIGLMAVSCEYKTTYFHLIDVQNAPEFIMTAPTLQTQVSCFSNFYRITRFLGILQV